MLFIGGDATVNHLHPIVATHDNDLRQAACRVTLGVQLKTEHFQTSSISHPLLLFWSQRGSDVKKRLCDWGASVMGDCVIGESDGVACDWELCDGGILW